MLWSACSLLVLKLSCHSGQVPFERFAVFFKGCTCFSQMLSSQSSSNPFGTITVCYSIPSNHLILFERLAPFTQMLQCAWNGLFLPAMLSSVSNDCGLPSSQMVQSLSSDVLHFLASSSHVAPFQRLAPFSQVLSSLSKDLFRFPI